MRHLPYEERLQRRLLRANLITAFKIFKGLLVIDPNLFFLPPTRRGLRGHPYKVLQGARHRRAIGSAFSVRVVKYWNKLPASVVTATAVKMFSRKVGQSFGRSLSPSPLLTEHSFAYSPHRPTCTPPINSHHLYM